MRVRIVAFGYFATYTFFKIEGGTEGKELKVGNVVGYLDPETMEVVENPAIGERVAMVVPVSLEDSELEELYALPDDRLEDTLAVRKLAVKGHLHEGMRNTEMKHFCELKTIFPFVMEPDNYPEAHFLASGEECGKPAVSKIIMGSAESGSRDYWLCAYHLLAIEHFWDTCDHGFAWFTCGTCCEDEQLVVL